MNQLQSSTKISATELQSTFHALGFEVKRQQKFDLLFKGFRVYRARMSEQFSMPLPQTE